MKYTRDQLHVLKFDFEHNSFISRRMLTLTRQLTRHLRMDADRDLFLGPNVHETNIRGGITMFLTDFVYASRPGLYKLTLPYTTFFHTHKTTMLRLVVYNMGL